MYHLVSRNATEWNANSMYLWMLGHSKDTSFNYVREIRSDEVKHIAIFSGAYRYIFGNQKSMRLWMMIKKAYEEVKYEAQNRTEGNVLVDDPISLFEMALAHLIVERKVRQFYSEVPIKTLEKLFEADLHLELPSSDAVTSEKQAKIDEFTKAEAIKRRNLSRWE